MVTRGTTLKLIGEAEQTEELKERFGLMISILRQKQELSIQTLIDLLNGNNPMANKIVDSNPAMS